MTGKQDSNNTQDNTQQTQDQSAVIAEMQRQIALLQDQLTKSNQPVQQLDPRIVRTMPGYLPARHSSDTVTRLAVRARDWQLRDVKDIPLPDSAKDVAPLDRAFVHMPPGGVTELAELLYPDDFGNQEAMDAHIHDLLILNRDVIRNDTAYQVGTMVRVK